MSSWRERRERDLDEVVASEAKRQRRLSPAPAHARKAALQCRAAAMPTAARAAPVKKLIIRPFRSAPKPPDNFFNDTWNRFLNPAVLAVHNSTGVPFSLEELYGKVEDACLHKYAPKLYDALYTACNVHVRQEISKLLSQPVDSDTFLRLVDDAWHRHCQQMLRIRAIFLKLDRTYIVQGCHPEARSLWDMGLQLFRTHLAKAKEVETKTISGLLELINRERDGEAIDKSLLKSLLRMLSAIGTYDNVFERPFVAATEEYYRKESEKLIAEFDVPTYMIHAEKRIRDEVNRVVECLNGSTRKSLLAVIEKKLVVDHVRLMLTKGLDPMCDEQRIEDLKRCYSLMSRANSHIPLGKASAHETMRYHLITYVKNVGIGIVMDREKDSEMVQSLLDLKAKMDELVSRAFADAEIFATGVSQAFEYFVNLRENKPAEFIAKFVDGILRTGNKGFSEEELENTLDRALTLFRYINGKDVFEAFFKKDLAKRLLYDKSASLDLEKSMISKLKALCGSQFTSKLEAMFRDVDASKDLMHSFKNHAISRTSRAGSVDLNVFVLEAARWPLTTQEAEVKLPNNLIDHQETFKKFYLEKHAGRKLSWQHIDGTCVVTARFPKGVKLLSLSLYQTVILVLFNDTDEMGYRDIAAATGIDEQQLKRTLLSLACGKVRVLQKRPKGPTVNNDDVFYFNKLFFHKQRRIKVNAIQMKETVEENAATTEKIFQERNCQIDAALVRIMKTRRTLSHGVLIAEIYSQLRFPHKPGDIKKRIESLIEREYLARDENNAQTYHYLA